MILYVTIYYNQNATLRITRPPPSNYVTHVHHLSCRRTMVDVSSTSLLLLSQLLKLHHLSQPRFVRHGLALLLLNGHGFLHKEQFRLFLLQNLNLALQQQVSILRLLQEKRRNRSSWLVTRFDRWTSLGQEFQQGEWNVRRQEACRSWFRSIWGSGRRRSCCGLSRTWSRLDRRRRNDVRVHGEFASRVLAEHLRRQMRLVPKEELVVVSSHLWAT